MKVTLFVPTLNEIEGVKAIMPRIKKGWVDEVLVIDGHSTDGTKEYMEKAGYRVLTQKGPGMLAAWWEGFDAATGDVIIPFSPDNNSIPEVIPLLVEKIKEGYDVAIASRYKGDAKSEDDNKLTSFGNWLFTSMINAFYGANYTDALGMYKAFKKDLIRTLEMDKHKDEIFEVLFAIRCAKKKLKVCEIAAPEPKRIGGDSRGWPGLTGRAQAGFLMMRCILKELFN